MRTPVRSESMAYPKANTSTLLSKINFCIRQNTRAFLATVAFLLFVLIIASDYFHDFRTESANMVRKRMQGTSSSSSAYSQNWGGAVHAGYFMPQDVVVPNVGATQNDSVQYHFAAVTDLDQLSIVPGKMQWRSVLLPGLLTKSSSSSEKPYTIIFEPSRTLFTKHNEAGRGAEFSELTLFQNRLLTFDDRTGDVFEILNTVKPDGTPDSYCVPRFVITEGNGETDKGMKWEWSTVKDGELYMGSMGKEYTRPDGSIENANNLWVGVLDEHGELRRENWMDKYHVIRHALQAISPGYLIIEAVNWSPILRKWIFLPRRISIEPYDDIKDEKMGGNKLVMVDEDFTNPQVVEIQFETRDPLRGFSTFAFVPGTGDRHAFVVRSVEEDCVGGDSSVCKQRSYFSVLDILTGKMLSEEVKYSEDIKFEGLEFVNIYTKPQ
jgi:soluble calcium-activated nucleotidase 1